MEHTISHDGVRYAKKSDRGKAIMALKKEERVRRFQQVTKGTSVLLAKSLAVAAIHST